MPVEQEFPFKGPRARNTHELSFFISFQDCPKCGSRLDENLFHLSAETETGAAMSGKCSHCRKPLGFSFLGGNLLSAPSGNWDEVAPGRTEILILWQLAAEIERLSHQVVTDPTQLDAKQWQINREINHRVILCVHELVKLLDDGKYIIADDLLSDKDREYREQNPLWFTRKWMEDILNHHRQIVEANIKDLPRINQLEASAKYRRSKKNRPAGSANTPIGNNNTDQSPT
jgi:hypothetical protein